MCTLQFISTLEANVFAKIDAIVNVSITKVVTGSAVVTNSVAFTGSDSNAASAEQTALYQTLTSGDTTIFGTSFGRVVVSNITQGNATNPSKTAFHLVCMSHAACCLTTCLSRTTHSQPCFWARCAASMLVIESWLADNQVRFGCSRDKWSHVSSHYNLDRGRCIFGCNHSWQHLITNIMYTLLYLCMHACEQNRGGAG